MPFIDCKFSKQLTHETCDNVKRGFGELIGVMGKSESYLMVGIEDNHTLYLGGRKLENGAFIAVSVYGGVNPVQSRKMTEKVCDFLEDELGISPEDVYITYQGIENWGWNGGNF